MNMISTYVNSMQSPFPKLASFARCGFYASTLIAVEEQGLIA